MWTPSYFWVMTLLLRTAGPKYYMSVHSWLNLCLMMICASPQRCVRLTGTNCWESACTTLLCSDGRLHHRVGFTFDFLFLVSPTANKQICIVSFKSLQQSQQRVSTTFQEFPRLLSHQVRTLTTCCIIILIISNQLWQVVIYYWRHRLSFQAWTAATFLYIK